MEQDVVAKAIWFDMLTAAQLQNRALTNALAAAQTKIAGLEEAAKKVADALEAGPSE